MKPRRTLLWSALLASLAGTLTLLLSCQTSLIYHPRTYTDGEPERFEDLGGQRIEVTTSEGRQLAWMRGTLGPSGKIWVICGGNATRALDLVGRIGIHLTNEDVAVHLDYPGYGLNDGSPSPSSLRESTRMLVLQAAHRQGLSAGEVPTRTVALGHSLGAAVAMLVVDELHLNRVILLAPFTSTMDMAEQLVGLPLGPLVTHRYDNERELRAFTAREGQAWILHGTLDEVIPFSMGQRLHEIAPNSIHFSKLEHVGHNDIFEHGSRELARAIEQARN